MHEGHRERLKKRFLEEGLDSFEPHQILELLLFYSIPRKDTNEIAHGLIERFGSISGVFEADPKMLESVMGMGKSSAVLLALIPALTRIYLRDKWGERSVINSSVKAGEYAAALFAGRTYEVFYLVCLDSQNKVIYSSLLHEGTINETAVYPRKVVEEALRHKAVNVILAHNHPGGGLTPSRADIDVTAKIKTALNSISINVIDHIVVAGEKYISFAEKGLL